MAYTKNRTIDYNPSGTTVRNGVLYCDLNIDDLVSNLNTHEALTTGCHGVSTAGVIVGTTDTQTLTNKTLSSPVLTGTVTASGATITGGTIANVTLASPTLTGTVTASGATITGGTISSVTLAGTITSSGATLTGGTIANPTLTGTVTASGATITGGTIGNSTLTGTLTATNATITGGTISTPTILNPTLTGTVTASSATITGTTLSNPTITGTVGASGGTIQSPTITGATITNSTIGSSNTFPTSSESTAGIAEIATQIEVDAGTDDARFVTPLKVKKYTGLRGMKNLLINGGMMIGQRPSGQTLDHQIRYGRVDRWHAYWSSSTGVTPGAQGHQTSGDTESYRVMALTQVTCSAANTLFVGQRIESVNSRYLRFANDYGGVSFRIKVWHNFGVNVSMNCSVYTANATDNFSTMTSRYTSSGISVPSGTFTTLKFEGFDIGTTNVENGVAVYLRVDTPVCSGATIYLGDAQLEIGPVCTDLEKRPYGLELAMCQRYYQVYGGFATNQLFATGIGASTTTANCCSPYSPRMRTQPTISFSAPGDFRLGANIATAISAITSQTGDGMVMFQVTIANPELSGNTPYFLIANNSNARMYLSAEL